MNAIKLSLSPLRIPMKVSFKHASAERHVTESVWVTAKRGTLTGLGEGCPRVYVTGETLDGAMIWAQSKVAMLEERVHSLADLKLVSKELDEEIKLNLSAWCALELAILDLLAQEVAVSLEKLLGVSEERTRFTYAAVLSADDETKFARNIDKYLRYGFSDFKLKVVAKEADDIPRLEQLKSKVSPGAKLCWPPVRLLASAYAARNPFEFRLRLDGNNAWAGREHEIDSFLDKAALKPWAIEEPFAPYDFERLSDLSRRHNIGIILDESLCRLEDVIRASKYEARWVANMRVSKLGGLLRSLEIAENLKDLGWEIIVGAQVGETSVLSRAALVVARAAGSLLVSQEGAFGDILLERDRAVPMLKFGLAGLVHNTASSQKGLGLMEVEGFKL
ncbi:MAG: enolase C-terminal domain-like protein [Bdellovibrionota bacterium]